MKHKGPASETVRISRRHPKPNGVKILGGCMMAASPVLLTVGLICQDGSMLHTLLIGMGWVCFLGGLAVFVVGRFME